MHFADQFTGANHIFHGNCETHFQKIHKRNRTHTHPARESVPYAFYAYMHIAHSLCIQYTCTLNARRNRKLKMKPQFFSIFVCHPLWFCNPKYERIRGLNNRQKWMQNQCCNHENITSHVKIHTHNSPIMLRAVVVGMNFCVGLSDGGFATPWV